MHTEGDGATVQLEAEEGCSGCHTIYWDKIGKLHYNKNVTLIAGSNLRIQIVTNI